MQNAMALVRGQQTLRTARSTSTSSSVRLSLRSAEVVETRTDVMYDPPYMSTTVLSR